MVVGKEVGWTLEMAAREARRVLEMEMNGYLPASLFGDDDVNSRSASFLRFVEDMYVLPSKTLRNAHTYTFKHT
jgi:hypothetical protein